MVHIQLYVLWGIRAYKITPLSSRTTIEYNKGLKIRNLEKYIASFKINQNPPTRRTIHQ